MLLIMSLIGIFFICRYGVSQQIRLCYNEYTDESNVMYQICYGECKTVYKEISINGAKWLVWIGDFMSGMTFTGIHSRAQRASYEKNGYYPTEAEEKQCGNYTEEISSRHFPLFFCPLCGKKIK